MVFHIHPMKEIKLKNYFLLSNLFYSLVILNCIVPQMIKKYNDNKGSTLTASPSSGDGGTTFSVLPLLLKYMYENIHQERV